MSRERAQRRDGARREDRARVLALPLHAGARSHVCCGANNRGVAILGDTLLYGHARRASDCDRRQDRPAALECRPWPDYEAGYSITMAPLIVKDKVIVGIGGGEFGIRGFIAAYDGQNRQTGLALQHHSRPRRAWPRNLERRRLEDTAALGLGDRFLRSGVEPDCTGASAIPGPTGIPISARATTSIPIVVVALDADTGKLKWHYQFTPNDGYDYDSVQIPVLVDMDWQGSPPRSMLWANRNGYFYVLDRDHGKFLLGKPFVKVNWASGLDAERAGRSRRRSRPECRLGRASRAAPTGIRRPSVRAPGCSISRCGKTTRRSYRKEESQVCRRAAISSAAALQPCSRRPRARRTIGVGRAARSTTGPNEVGSGAVIAIDPHTGKREWTFPQYRRDGRGHADDGVGPALHRRARGIFLRARCEDRERNSGRQISAARS